MRILICGGYGFIGNRLLSYLLNKGCEIFTLSHRAHEPIPGVHEFVYENFEQVKLLSLISEINPDCTVFLATQYDNGDLDKIIDVNIKLPSMLMKAISRLPESQRNFVMTDSYWSLGSKESKGIPLDDYAAAKGAVKEFAKTYSYYNKVKIINLMVYGTYGNGDRRGKILDVILDAVRDKKEIHLTAGEQYIDLVHVDDVCSAYLRAIEYLFNSALDSNNSFCTFAVGSSSPIQLKEIIAKIGKKYDVSMIHTGTKEYRERELFHPQYEHSSVPDWFPEYDLWSYIDDYLTELK